MSHLFSLCWRYIISFALIYGCLSLGKLLSTLLPIALPGSILGMLLLFALLASNLLPVKWVKPGCQLLIRYMTLLFVPVAVGIMAYYQLLMAQFAPIVLSSIVSTLITLLVVAYGAHFTYRNSEDPPPSLKRQYPPQQQQEK